MKMENNNYVNWKIFTWTMGIILTLFGFSFGFINGNRAKVDSFNRDVLEIKVQLSQIQTDIAWIKNNLTKK